MLKWLLRIVAWGEMNEDLHTFISFLIPVSLLRIADHFNLVSGEHLWFHGVVFFDSEAVDF